MRNIEYYRGRVAKVMGGQEAMAIIEEHRGTSFQGRNGPLSYKLKLTDLYLIDLSLIAPAPARRWAFGPANIYIYIYIYGQGPQHLGSFRNLVSECTS